MLFIAFLVFYNIVVWSQIMRHMKKQEYVTCNQVKEKLSVEPVPQLMQMLGLE